MKTKRIASLLIISMMLIQMLPFDLMTAAAVTETDSSPAEQEEVVQQEEENNEEEVLSDEKEDEAVSSDAAEKEAGNNKEPALQDQTDDEEGNTAAGGDVENDASEDEASEDSAEYIKNKDVEAVDIQGEAALSRSFARELLLSETAIKVKAVDRAVDELFSEDENTEETENESDDPGVRAEEETELDVPPRQGDGSNIEGISAKWITSDSVNNEDDALLYRKPSRTESQAVRLQVNYALSGEHSYNPGDITITVPAHIFKDRNGKDYGKLIIPYPEDPSMKGDFNWKLVGDNYILTNCKRMSAATKGYIQFQIEGMAPSMLVDMEVSDPFSAYIEVTTHKGNIIALRSNELTAQFDTEARLTAVNKRENGVTRVKASQIPASQRVEGEETYIKVDWYVWGTTYANTYFTIDQVDSIPQDALVEDRVVVADGEVKNPLKEISITDAKEIDPSIEIGGRIQQKESDVHGFIIGGSDSAATELEKKGIYRGAVDGNGSYYYFSTAYPASQFKPDVEYTFHNSITYTVTEVDPEVTDNTNPNVNEGKPDPQLVTTKTTTPPAQVKWHYSDPKWINPGGHYMIYKNGNDDTEGRNITHRSSYPYDYSDLHRSGGGYYGIYPSALNELQDENKDHGENGSIRLSYTINTVGYTLPWMYDGGMAVSNVENPARVIANYNRPIQMTSTDTGISIGRNGAKLKVFDDYTFAEVEFPEIPYIYSGKPQNIEPDGTWTALDAGDGTFRYTRDNNKADWPDITLQIQRGGSWEDWAAASWKSGSKVITLHDGTTQTSGVIPVPEDTRNVRTVVVTHNTNDEEGAEEAVQAAIDYDLRVVINLKSTSEMMALIDEAFTKSRTPSMAVYNGVNMLIERADEALDSEEREIHSIDREGYDSIRGYTTDTAVYPYKSSTQKLSEVNYEDRLIPIHYEAKVEIRSVINEKKTWQQAVDEGRLDADTHGFWRDLLPKGVTPDISTIKLRPGDKVVDVTTVENYEGSGRTLLIVEADLKPVPVSYRSGDMTYYEDVPSIRFDAFYDFESLKDYGSYIHNVISFESSNDHLGTIKDYKGEPDDPFSSNNVFTKNAFTTDQDIHGKTEKDYMKDLDPDRDDPSFVYAGTFTRIDILNAARTSLYKDVQVNNDGIWSDGTYYKQYYGEPVEATEGGRMRTVYEGGQYSYRLRIMSDPDTISTDMIIYDSLENFYATGNTDDADNDKIDYVAPEDKGVYGKDPHWQGTFLGIDTSQMEEIGCAPVIYYSTIEELPLSDEGDPDAAHSTNVDLNGTAPDGSKIWVKASEYTGRLADVKAVAIDCSKANENADEHHRSADGRFHLLPMESIVALVKMQAPSGQDARAIIANKGEWGESGMAYNNAYLLCTNMDKDQDIDDPESVDKENFIRKDYTKVGLKEYSASATKKWNDDNNRDGIRPKTVKFTLYADGEPVLDENGEPVTRTLDAEHGETRVTFEHIPYTTPEGEKIHYTIEEDPVEGYTASHTIANVVEGVQYDFTNTHEPEKISVSGEKTWEGDEENNRPSSIDVDLYANGNKLKSQTVKPDSEGLWSYTFTDLFKYENGEEIVYTVKEAKTKNTGDALDSYTHEIDGFDIKNTYHPFGDLRVTKNIVDTTEVSGQQGFTFTFTFTAKRELEDGSTEEAPVFDPYEYEVMDEEGNAVTGDDGEPLTGTVTTNGTVTIKGGQTIHVKDIPEYISYKVAESEEAGFSLTEKTGDSGTIEPNRTSEAEFTNKYIANGQINLGALKKLYNRILNKYQFRFELYEVKENEDGGQEEVLKSTASSSAPTETHLREDGTVDYSTADATFGVIRYTQEDHGKTYVYRIKEIDTEKPGYTYSEDVYSVEVSITDKGDGTLGIVPVYKNAEGNKVDAALFENTYKAEGNTTLRAWKDLQARDLKEDEFTFELLDEHGDPVTAPAAEEPSEEGGGQSGEQPADDQTLDPAGDDQSQDPAEDEQEAEEEPVTRTNKADKTVVFSYEDIPALNYDEKDIGKTFYYAIREKAGTDDTVIYDDRVFGYKIDIVDNGDGKLYAEQKLMKSVVGEDGRITEWKEIGAELPVFTNTLKDGRFSITKTVEESPDANPAQLFRFKVKLIGDKVTDDLIDNYILTKAGEEPADEEPSEEQSDSDESVKPSEEEDTSEEQNKENTPAEPQADGNRSADTEAVSPKAASSGIRLMAADDETVVHSDADTGSCKAGCEQNGSGGVNWRILSDGTLVIGKEGETQTFRHEAARWAYQSNNSYSNPSKVYDSRGAYLGLSSTSHLPFYPWLQYEKEIKKVRFEGTVKGNGDMNGMFDMCINLETVDFNGFDTSAANGLGYLFYNNKSLTSVKNMDKLDTSKMTWMNYIFYGCSALKDIDVSNVTTPSLTYFGWFFSGCSSLEELDLSGFDQYSPRVITQYTTSANATMYMNNFFDNCTKLNTIVLGPNFRFRSRNDSSSYSTLPNPPNGQTWVRQEGQVGSKASYTSAELRNNYTSSWAGTWVWSGKTFYTVHFLADEAAGGTAPVKMLVGEDSKLPANSFSKYGYDFDHWIVTDEYGTPITDVDKTTYKDKETIPAGTYQMNDHVYLKAVFEERDTSVDMNDGEFYITLRADEMATFKGIPAGTAYQIYEETPQGWVLLRQDNVSGTIEPLVTKAASFVNKYEPGTTSAQFFGTKTLDNRAASAGRFSFILKDSEGRTLQTKQTLDGGFIQFEPIIFKQAGTFTYTIEETDMSDSTIEYDTHTETVTVTVTDDDEGNLNAEVTYDNDGVKFANKTRPGSLKVSKAAEGLTEANKDDEFTFRITLNNPNGMPLGSDDTIYWYKEGEKAPENSNNDPENAGPADNGGTERKPDQPSDQNILRAPVLAPNGADSLKPQSAGLRNSLRLTGSGDTQISVTDFAYTGSYQEYIVPADGIYQIEAWGAQGGNSALDGGRRNSAYLLDNDRTELGHAHGGCGGYTSGSISLKAGTVLYIYVGGRGADGDGRKNSNGGWNGGGIGVWDQTNEYNGQYGYPNEIGNETDGGGGGATDIRLTSGDWNSFASLKSRIMVAGGGGGASDTGYGGDAGGIESLAGNTGNHTSSYVQAARATQSSGNAFGAGQDGSLLYANYPSAGGGGGWYGGRHQNLERNPRDTANYIWQNPGAGGSSFISGHGGCNAIDQASTAGSIRHTGQPKYSDEYVFTDTQMIAGYNSMPNPAGGTEEHGHEGNGYARITPLQLESNDLLIHLDANEGFSPVQWIIAGDLTEQVTLAVPTRPGYLFAGWNTAADGSGNMYNGTVTGEDLGAQLGTRFDLYAQWLDEKEYARYTVEHYRQNADGSDYSLYETDNLIGRRGDTVAPEEKEYEGYIIRDHEAEYTVPEGDIDLVVKYYYDLLTYNVKFDGNGATSGEMSDMTDLLGGKQYTLTQNSFKKDDSIFTGWNTEANGNGRSYTDQQKVKNLTKENNGTVTLYAQWLSKEDHALEPTDGVIIVKCKAGETIVIPDLPAGTTYTIEEIDNPAGWSQKGEIVSGSGSITPNVTDQATVTNEYKASGEALINAHKILEGADIEEGQFTFVLTDSEGNEIGTATNGAVDTYEEVEKEDGSFGPNPYYGQSLVQFSSPQYTQDDIGKTYTYYIREVKDEQDTSIAYDSGVIKVLVTVNDAGKGQLIPEVRYEDENGMPLANEGLFTNVMNPAKLVISKEIEKAEEQTDPDETGTGGQSSSSEPEDESYKETEFTFTVVLRDKDGAEVQGSFDAVKGDEQIKVASGDTVTLKGGESIEISGLPHGAVYEITEADEQEDWEQAAPVDGEGAPAAAAGELKPGETSEALFRNVYHQPPEREYTATGKVQLKARKSVIGGPILDDDQFMFELVDEEGELIESKPCDEVSGDDGTLSESDITFKEIDYDLSQLDYPADKIMEAEQAALKFINDKEAEYNSLKKQQEDDETFPDFDTWFSQQDGSEGMKPLEYLQAKTREAQAANPREATFIYYVRELSGDDPDVEYDSTRYYYKVRVVDGGEGELIPTVTKWKMGAEEDTEITGDITFFNKKTTQVKVNKRWTDMDDQDGMRPTAEEFRSKIHLMAGDKEIQDAEPVITEDEAGNFTILYTGLPAFDENGEKIVYTVKEDEIENYKPQNDVTEAADGETLTNIHTPAKRDITVRKIWDDDNDAEGHRGSVGAKVQLYKQSEGKQREPVGDPVDVPAEDGWSYTWTELPVNDSGNEIIYTVDETMAESRYYSSSSGRADEEGVITVTNTSVVTDLVITKKMPELVEGEGINATLVFEVKGTDSAGSIVYQNTVGIVFNEKSGQYETKVLEDVPNDCTMTVTEVYSGDYEPVKGTITKTSLEDYKGKDAWVFEFENHVSSSEDGGRNGDGVVNKYENTGNGIRFREAEK